MEPQTRPPTRIKALLLQGDCNIMPGLSGRDLVPLQLYILTLCMLSVEEWYRSLMFVTLSLPYLSDIGLHSSSLPIKFFYLRQKTPLYTCTSYRKLGTISVITLQQSYSLFLGWTVKNVTSKGLVLAQNCHSCFFFPFSSTGGFSVLQLVVLSDEQKVRVSEHLAAEEP